MVQLNGCVEISVRTGLLALFIDSVATLSVVVLVFTFAWSCYKHNGPDLGDLTSRMLAASMIPTGVALLVCAVWPEYLSRLSGISIYIALSGIVVIFTSFKTVVRVDTAPAVHAQHEHWTERKSTAASRKLGANIAVVCRRVTAIAAHLTIKK